MWFIYRYLLLLPYHSLCTQYNESYLPKKKALWRSLQVYYHWLRNKSNNFPPELSILKGFDYIKLKSPEDSILIQLCLIFFVAVCMRLWSRGLTTEFFFFFLKLYQTNISSIWSIIAEETRLLDRQKACLTPSFIFH